jgi:hypothetical protein
MREFIERVPEPYITELEKKAGEKKIFAEAMEPAGSMILTEKGDLVFGSATTGRIFVLPQATARAVNGQKFYGEAMPLGELEKLKSIFQCQGKIYAQVGDKIGLGLSDLDKKIAAALEGFEKMPRWLGNQKIPSCRAVSEIELKEKVKVWSDRTLPALFISK